MVLELTYRCPLKCPWCNNPLNYGDFSKEELTTDEWKHVLREARRIGSLQLGFSGGEPLLRPDLEELMAEADGLGFYTNLITSGVGLTRKRLEALKKAGLKQIQISLQHSDPVINNAMVGVDSFEEKMEAIRHIKELGFPVVMNVPMSRFNIDTAGDMIDLCEKSGIEFLELVNLQYYNWALLNRAELLPSREQLEEAEEKVIKARERLGNAMTIYFVVPDYFDGRPKACMNGWGAIHMTIAPDGAVLPCQEARVIEGMEFPKVTEHDLGWIWHESPTFMKFRGNEWMKEPCQSCDEKEKDFGGCRCQSFVLTGDAANTDPACSKSEHFKIIESSVENARNRIGPGLPLVMRSRGSIGSDLKALRP